MSSMLITPAQVNALSGQRIMLIDIRGQDEWRREHLAGARALPLEQIQPGCFDKENWRKPTWSSFTVRAGCARRKLNSN